MSRSPRADLLALTPDDLATLTNRGTVKRAQKEIETGEPTVEIQEEASGDLVFLWSDGISCRFPADRPMHDAGCSSGLAGISRHIIRSILAYQKVAADRPGQPEIASEAAVDLTPAVEQVPTETPPALISTHSQSSTVWDPGAITDDELIAHFRKPAILKARKRFEQGVLVELTRGSKPVARFLDGNVTVRFLVPGSLHYVSADCAEAALPLWLPIAVWAFRELPPQRRAGLVSLHSAPQPIPRSELQKLDALLSELYRDGLDGAAGSWAQRLSRIEKSLRNDGLVWPAELLVDLAHQFEMYREHDARFEPRQVVQLLGELIIRVRAILNETQTVPQLMVRGSKSDRPVDIAGGRMIGVGLGIRPGRKHTNISAYLQDVDNGGVVAVERTFATPEDARLPASFESLAALPLSRGISLANLASSHLLLKSGKRTPSGLLILPRTAASLASHPQGFRWEELKPPFAAEGFDQLAERFETLPPSALRPRRRTENLHVVAVQRADAVAFDPTQQRLTARLLDPNGSMATLMHPYHHRAREGFNELLSLLETRGDRVRFVSGHVRSVGRTLEIQPISIVIDDGERRLGILPWVPVQTDLATNEATPLAELSADPQQSESIIGGVLLRLDDLLSDLLLTGLTRAPANGWTGLAKVAQQAGFVRLSASIDELAHALQARADSLRWDPSPAERQARELCLASRLASE